MHSFQSIRRGRNVNIRRHHHINRIIAVSLSHNIVLLRDEDFIASLAPVVFFHERFGLRNPFPGHIRSGSILGQDLIAFLLRKRFEMAVFFDRPAAPSVDRVVPAVKDLAGVGIGIADAVEFLVSIRTHAVDNVFIIGILELEQRPRSI